MKNFLFGLIVGIILMCLFVYFGGGKLLKALGMATTELGERIEVVEQGIKDTTEELLKKKK